MRPTDISIDLETLGNRYDAAIISIGAVAFDRHSGKIGPTYYSEVEFDDAMRYGRINSSTLAWWIKQDAKAKRLFSEGGSKVKLYEALRGLSDFARAQPTNCCVWGNGSSFDISILEHAYDRAGNGLREAWEKSFWLVRDLRTAIDAAGLDKSQLKFDGVAHNALDDAKHQAKVIVRCFERIRAAGITSLPEQPQKKAAEDEEL